jgi:TolB-like protein
LILAWAYELTPQGVKRTKMVPLSDSVAKMSGRKLDFVIIGLLVLAVGVMFVDNYVRDDADSGAGATVDLLEEAEAPSIAVLPFADMSPNGDQEYFGDGIAEELLNELVRLDGLRVAGRTSSFSFKGTNENLNAIAEALNVGTILEGSIRKDGGRIRITAQLINAADGYHIWSDTYDRELVDIFAIQEEIATSVAGALGVRLGVGDVNSFKGAGTQNVDAYEIFLQGEQLSGRVRSQERIRLFERAIELDPNYAAAWASLGLTMGATMWINPPEDAPAILDRSIPIVLKAVELDPDSAFANTLMATVNYARMDWIGSEEFYRKSLSLLSNRENLAHHANMLTRAGRSTSAQQLFALIDSAESIPAPASTLRLNTELAQRRFTEAKEISSRLSNFGRIQSNLLIALNERDPATLKAAISELPQSDAATMALYMPVLRDIESPQTALSTIKAIYADKSVMWPSKYHDISLLAAYFGDAEFSLDVMSIEARLTTVRLGALWYPLMSEARQLPEFKDLVTDINLVEYWRIYSWADHCKPVGDNDFVCS